MGTIDTAPARIRGLTEAEALRRASAGLSNHASEQRSRSYGNILRANLFNRFNALLGALLAITIWLGPIQDAVFGLILAANLAIGLSQEIRAKIILDRLTVLTATRARVMRDGSVRDIATSDAVRGDVLLLSRGDQVVADGFLLEAADLEIDESLLTGESEPVSKTQSARVLSGTFVVAGSGLFEATDVGAAAYGRRLASEARRFKQAPSELRSGTNRILRAIGWIMPPAALLLLASQFRAHASWIDAARATVAALVTLVPEGLVLLTSLAFAVAVLRLARRGALAQDLAAIETLARVDVVCMDKTGTLTEGRISLSRVQALQPRADVEQALGAVAAAEPNPNAVLVALAEAFPKPEGWTALSRVAFSSARRWSAASFEGRGTWVLGAPEAIVPREPDAAWESTIEQARTAAEAGCRVLVFASTPTMPVAAASPPPDLSPAGLILLEERLRPEAAAMVEYFRREGVELRIITGDSELTAAAIARRVGLDPASVTGRVAPEDKRRIIQRLQAAGHVVAMAGDGVNDVPALKQADVGISLASGSPAARAISQFVLLHSSFESVPEIVAEGRRVIGNMERLGKLFVTKTAYAFVLSLLVGVVALPFPLLLRQLTLVTLFTLGLPSFLLALEPNLSRARPGFAWRTVRLAAPAGTIVGIATFGAFAASIWFGGAAVGQGRSVATLVLGGSCFWLLTIVSRPMSLARSSLLMVMALLSAVALAIPAVREFFAIETLPGWEWALAAASVLAGGFLLEVAVRFADRIKRHPPQASRSPNRGSIEAASP
jgi:cation-transporting ATPase E